MPEWDEEKYPYAFITVSSWGTELTLDSLPRTFRTAEEQDGFTVYDELYSGSKAPQSAYYEYEDGNEEWVFDYETEYGTQSISLLSSAKVWANYDILKSDGTLYLAASEPVPIVPTPPSEQTAFCIGKAFGRLIRNAMKPVAIPATEEQ